MFQRPAHLKTGACPALRPPTDNTVHLSPSPFSFPATALDPEMDTPTAPTASESRAPTPLTAKATPSRAETLTVVSTHDSRKGPKPDTDNEKSEVEPVVESESRILTGRKLFLVFVYVLFPYQLSTSFHLLLIHYLFSLQTAVSSSPFSSSPSTKPSLRRPFHESPRTLMR